MTEKTFVPPQPKYFWSIPWVRNLILIVVVVLVVTGVLKALTPPPVPIATTELTTTSLLNLPANLKNLTYSGEPIDIPKEFTIGIVSAKTPVDSYRDKLITTLALKQGKQTDTWQSFAYSLTKSPDSGQYTLSSNYAPAQISSTSANIEKAKGLEIAESTFRTYFPDQPNITTKEGLITYLKGEFDLEKATEKDANWMFIPYTYFIDGFPVHLGRQQVFPFQVTVDNQYQVKSVTFPPYLLTFTAQQKNSSLSLEKALANISEKKGAIIGFVNQGEHGPIDLEDVESGDFANVFIEYRYDEKLKLIYPFFRFTGNVKNKAGATYYLEVITPAVNTISN